MRHRIEIYESEPTVFVNFFVQLQIFLPFPVDEFMVQGNRTQVGKQTGLKIAGESKA
jgi:hypothetical protein